MNFGHQGDRTQAFELKSPFEIEIRNKKCDATDDNDADNTFRNAQKPCILKPKKNELNLSTRMICLKS